MIRLGDICELLAASGAYVALLGRKSWLHSRKERKIKAMIYTHHARQRVALEVPGDKGMVIQYVNRQSGACAFILRVKRVARTWVWPLCEEPPVFWK